MSKYIECRHSALVGCKDSTGAVHKFYPKRVNNYTGEQHHNGFTEITDELYEDLSKNSRVFIFFEKNKKLIVHDELPANLQDPAYRLLSSERQLKELSSKMGDLVSENAKLKSLLEKNGISISGEEKKKPVKKQTKKKETVKKEEVKEESSPEEGKEE